MASYLIDSSILIDLSRKHAPAKKWIDQFDVDDLVISFVTVAELLSGCRNKREQERVETDLVDYPILWATQETQMQAMALLSQFKLSHGIGFLDCLIASTALTNGLPLTTMNYKHFQMIPGLKVERPY